jgi:GDP-L-fucose synthase
MNIDSAIYVAGHNGLVGSAITSVLKAKGYTNLILKSYTELDLTDQGSTESFFIREKPEYVILAAAKVGGIIANNTYRADFIYDNLMIESNVIGAAWKNGVKKLLFLGSTCIYPKDAPQPLKESSLLTLPLEYTNEPYAIAKIAGLKMCESFNIQYGTDFISVMPTNLYGPSDNYDLEKSHVLPALLRKIHLAHCLEHNRFDLIRYDLDKRPVEGVNGTASEESIRRILVKYGIRMKDAGSRTQDAGPEKEDRSPKTGDVRPVTVTLWGTGKPFREFMYSEDLAEACVYLMENISVNDLHEAHRKLDSSVEHFPHFLNIGTGEEVTIRDLALRIKNIVGFEGEITFDSSKPDGTFRKVTDTTILKSLGFEPKTGLHKGLEKVYEDYVV